MSQLREISLRLTSGNFEKERSLICRAFIESYQNNLQILKDISKDKPTSLDQLTQIATEQEYQNYILQKKNVLFITAESSDATPLGYASFDHSINDPLRQTAYLRMLVTEPSYQRKGVGKQLVFSVLKFWPKVKKIEVSTRRANNQAVSFYRKLGFKPTKQVHEDLDPQFYCGLEFFLDKKTKHLL